MPNKLLDLSKATPFDQLLIALVGKEKSGKSRLAATAPTPILFFDFDGRISSVAGRANVYGVSYVDKTGHMQPDVFTDFITKLTLLEQNKLDLAMLGFNIEPGVVFARTIVLDSALRMAKAAMRYILANGSKGVTRTISISGMAINSPGGFDAWNAEMSAIEDSLLRTFALGTNVIMTFHENPEEAPESTNEHPVFTGRVGIFPVRYQRLLGYFNEVWRVTRSTPSGNSSQDSVPSVSTAPSYDFAYGASCLNIDANEVPDIQAMIAKHIARQGNMSPAPQQSSVQAKTAPKVVMLQPVEPITMTESKTN
jgi:hypothetical protein